MTASECGLRPRLQQVQAEARAAVTCLEIAVEKRLQCWATEGEEGRLRRRQRLEEVECELQRQGVVLSEHSAALAAPPREAQEAQQAAVEALREACGLETQQEELAEGVAECRELLEAQGRGIGAMQERAFSPGFGQETCRKRARGVHGGLEEGALAALRVTEGARSSARGGARRGLAAQAAG